MSPGYDDRLKDYVDVKERVRLFYERFPDGRLLTSRVEASSEPDNVPRVWVEAKAYRTPDDPLPGVGWSWMVLPGSTPYTRGSELENTETSAWGRAIGATGIGIAAAIASTDEVRSKAEPETDAGLLGTIVTQGTQDFELRALPSGGFATRFRLKDGRSSFICQAVSPLADALYAVRADLIDHRVTVYGHWTDESFKKGGQEVRYRLLHIERVETPDWTLPAAADDFSTLDFPAALPPIEAPSEPLFSDR